MAKGSQPGARGVTVWIIVFAAVACVCLVFLVIMYTGQEELNNEITRLAKENDRLMSSSEKSSLDLARTARPSKEGGPTVVGLLEEARSTTASLATGEASDDVATIRGKRDQLADAIAADRAAPDADQYADLSLYEGLTTLYDAFRSEHARRNEAEARVEQLDAEVTAQVELSATQKSDFEARVKELTDRMTQVEADRTAYRQQRDQAVAQLEQDFDQRREDREADLTAERQRNTTLKRDLETLRKRFRAQQEKFGSLLVGPGELVTARQPDGRILTVVPGDNVVYIDLGIEDRLMLGLRFSVYSAETGIPANGQAKAQIEVLSIAPSSAECRIVFVCSGAVLVEGDLVANPIYDAQRAVNFVVIGRFDLDRDGIFESDGKNTIESMIAGWGGEVKSELTALTDFVIVGGAPQPPRASRDASTETSERDQRRQRAWDRYIETLASARNLSVPVMSQDVFLSFLGQSRRVARR